eukprot:3359571-Alexandrium_andersonii.AAC.1
MCIRDRDAGRCFRGAAILAMRAERKQELAATMVRQSEEEDEEPGYEEEAVEQDDFEQEIQLTFKPQDREPLATSWSRGKAEREAVYVEDDDEGELLGRYED